MLDPEVRLWNANLKRLRENEKKQTITISIAAWNYDTEIVIDLINQTIQDFRVKYQESSIGLENLSYLQSIENKCKRAAIFALHAVGLWEDWVVSEPAWSESNEILEIHVTEKFSPDDLFTFSQKIKISSKRPQY